VRRSLRRFLHFLRRRRGAGPIGVGDVQIVPRRDRLFAPRVDPAGHGDGGPPARRKLGPPSPGLNSASRGGAGTRAGGHGQEREGGGVRRRRLVGIHECHPHLGPEHARGPRRTRRQRPQPAPPCRAAPVPPPVAAPGLGKGRGLCAAGRGRGLREPIEHPAHSAGRVVNPLDPPLPLAGPAVRPAPRTARVVAQRRARGVDRPQVVQQRRRFGARRIESAAHLLHKTHGGVPQRRRPSAHAPVATGALPATIVAVGPPESRIDPDVSEGGHYSASAPPAWGRPPPCRAGERRGPWFPSPVRSRMARPAARASIDADAGRLSGCGSTGAPGPR